MSKKNYNNSHGGNEKEKKINFTAGGFIGCGSSFDEAGTVIFGAPFDSTTSFRPGARFGSKTIRNESIGLETYSPYQDKDLTDYMIYDSGDLELCFGDTDSALSDVESCADMILNADKTPVMLGGEHLITLGMVRAVYKKYPDLRVIHFDAHTDLRDEYLGTKLSHAAVIRRCHDLLGDKKIYQFGIRSGERAEFEFAEKHNYINKYDLNGLNEVILELKAKPVYFTLDLDVLDPSVFPGTGTPEAGGITFAELLDAVIRMSGLNIVGCDITELSPVYDTSGCSAAVACKIVREILLAVN